MIELKMASASRGRTLVVVLTAALGLLTLTATARPQATPRPQATRRPQATPQPTPKATKEATHTKGAKHTKEAKAAKKRRVIPVTISKGETYTISGLEKGAKTESKAGKNPNALSIQPQPSGDIVLLGTEGGSWKIDATLAGGEEVTYDVKVKAEAPPINSLTPGTAPTAIPP
jgi:glucose/arabinose dehydrogenase